MDIGVETCFELMLLCFGDGYQEVGLQGPLEALFLERFKTSPFCFHEGLTR